MSKRPKSLPPDPPHVHRIFYDGSGLIVGTQFTNAPTTMDGYEYIDVENSFGVSPSTHKVNLVKKNLVCISVSNPAATKLPRGYEDHLRKRALKA